MQQYSRAAATQSFNAPPAVAGPAHSYHQVRVLIVDQDTGTCDALKLLMFDLGYRSTYTARSAMRALSLVGRFAPEIALLELNLPDAGVYRLAQVMRLHAQPHRNRLSLIAMAELETHASGELARAAGFDGYLAKPVRRLALEHLLRCL